MTETYFCLDIGGTNMKSAFMNENGEELSFLSKETLISSENLGCQIIDHYKSHRQNTGLKAKAAGVSIAAILQPQSLNLLTSTHLDKKPFNLKDFFKNNLNLDLAAQNDGHCMALGEMIFGQGQGLQNIICLSLGTGIGGGAILEKQLVRGSNGCALEVGHVVLDYSCDLDCACGNKGCWETLVGAKALSNHYQVLSGEKVSAEEIAQRARKEDPIAIQCFEKLGLWFGRGLGQLNNIFDPQKIILSGGLSHSFELFKEKTIEEMKKHSYQRKINRFPEIVLSKKQKSAGLLGALVLARDYCP